MLFVYDLELKRPGGPILQMMQGGSLDAMRRFPEQLWLHEITPGLKLCTVGEHELDELVEMTREANGGR
jgi:hypothetical protein